MTTKNSPAFDLGPKPVLVKGKPKGFYSNEAYCNNKVWLGQLVGEDGSRLNKNVRRKYYPAENAGHIAKTPLHAIRYAIDTYTKPGEWVLDPFMGSGTTGVEALVQSRKAAGVEFEFGDIAEATLSHFGKKGTDWKLLKGDASKKLKELKKKKMQFALVNFSNPYPDGGDHSSGVKGSNKQEYQKEGSAGLMRSNGQYWDLMKDIQDQCCELLQPSGHAVFVIKDMMKNKQVWELHRMLADLMPDYMEHVGTFALDHYPRSLAMNTYEQRWGVRPPLEQVCPVFKKNAKKFKKYMEKKNEG